MKIKNFYHYFFYKIYKSIEATSEPKFWSDWKAVVIINSIEIFIILSLMVYYTVFTGNNIGIGGRNLLIAFIVVGIVIPNYFVFHYRDSWKEIVKEYEVVPKEKEKGKGYIVRLVIILIIANLHFSYYTLAMKAQRNHTGPYSNKNIEQKTGH
jgi:hypothetical protein